MREGDWTWYELQIKISNNYISLINKFLYCHLEDDTTRNKAKLNKTMFVVHLRLMTLIMNYGNSTHVYSKEVYMHV